ncbi:MAG TPA: glycyl-radical enzyme activating protein [Spirochaetota bacterium]|nr:glycyl-radical enzyme activating protein [Spirochaetota bacterium]HPU86856.1 glycyl-radical enzyme activating protein [Spirochaetota bacterium]
MKSERDAIKGLVLNIQRMSTEDGPGIRTTVFVKGCSLACAWCHNPESIPFERQIQWIETKCIGCRTCVKGCPQQALSDDAGVIALDRAACTLCGICVDECPALAMELLGTEWGVDELADEVEKDRSYFESSGGGVTISGGEPCMQPEFTAAFLRECTRRGLHTALDTCGLCRKEAFDAILPHADLVLYDIKEIDPVLHKRFTGSGNERMLENLKHVRDTIAKTGSKTKLWIRTPIIPNATARDENIAGIGAYIAENIAGAVERWELCAFNNLCRDKYRRLDLEWDFGAEALLGRETMEHLANVARHSGVDPVIVHWSGATKFISDDEQADNDAKAHMRLVKGC